MTIAMGRAPSRALCVMVLALCGGCAHPPLYNHARDQQGQGARKAAAEVDLVATVEALDQKMRALSRLEADTHTSRAALQRDLHIAELAAAKGGTATKPLMSVQERYVSRFVDPRLQELVGTVPDLAELRARVAATDTSAERSRQLAGKLRVLSVVARSTIATCDAVRRMPLPVAADVAVLRNDAAKACDEADAPQVNAARGSMIDQLARDLKGDREAVRITRDRIGEHKRKLDDASDKAAREASGTTAQERLKSGAEKLQTRIDQLRSTATAIDSSAFSAALAQLRLESLDAVLKALSSGATELDGLEAGERRSVLVTRLIPSLVDEVRTWQQERARIRAAPLVLAKDHQRLVVAGHERRLAVLEDRVARRAAMLAAAHAEYAALARARVMLDAGQVDLGAPLVAVLDEGSERTRLHLYQSFAAVFDEAYVHRLSRELAQLEIDASASNLALEASRSAAAQWQNLATGIAAALSDYHASGLKPADIAEFLKAVGLVHIGNNAGK